MQHFSGQQQPRGMERKGFTCWFLTTLQLLNCVPWSPALQMYYSRYPKDLFSRIFTLQNSLNAGIRSPIDGEHSYNIAAAFVRYINQHIQTSWESNSQNPNVNSLPPSNAKWGIDSHHDAQESLHYLLNLIAEPEPTPSRLVLSTGFNIQRPDSAKLNLIANIQQQARHSIACKTAYYLQCPLCNVHHNS